MAKRRLIAVLILLLGVGVGYFVYSSQLHSWRPFKLGLDLSGGTELTYRADLSAIQGADVSDSMAALRDTIERRVNLFGVSEPLVQTETGGTFAGSPEQRLIVQLPGITNTQQAIALIGQTPVLEFRLLKVGATAPPQGQSLASSSADALFEPAAITGKDLASASLQFNSGVGAMSQPQVVLKFNSDGSTKFANLTAQNVGRIFGIFLDGVPISEPVIEQSIPDGTAVISGGFTATQARDLSRNLNEGALPVPITLLSTETISGTLGGAAVHDGIIAGLWGVGLVMLFMVLWYRLPGIIAVVALSIYVAFMLGIFMFLPVTLTAAGIAGFILSIGMAVDANILIFERTKEELRSGKPTTNAIHDGFQRAWPSIRDSNTSSMITAIILFWFGTSIIQGFALVFGLGVLVSMLTAISVSRTLLLALGIEAKGGFARIIFSSGISRN
ncbi:MAG TPA: protein translocase subunit SecD [Candidatus Paceibacterota bacterium]|nr:protein translocase subunit SecD [Candidatus Paceibacterota bacterium]